MPNPSLAKPCLRPLEPLPYEDEGEPYVAWRDPVGISPMVQVPAAVALLMSLFDGSRDTAVVASEWEQVGGEELPLEFVDQLVADLDEHLLLLSPRFRQARAAAVDEFRRLGVRPAAHCPDGYPAEPGECRAYLDRILAHADGAPTGSPRGLIAPHIDLLRGAPCYAGAYRALAGSTADLYVILGIAHSTSCWPEPAPLVTLTRLDFATPLGTVGTDRQFVDDLTARYFEQGGGGDLFADELVHRGEHSIEFQTLFLQHLHGAREYRIAPVLLGSLHEFYDEPCGVAGPAGLGPFIAALREAILAYPGEVCLIAGADLSHLGPRFGADQPVDTAWTERAVGADLAALRLLAEQGADPFFGHFASDGNVRNVCSVANLYALRAVLPTARFELLDHQAAYDPRQTVTFAAAALW